MKSHICVIHNRALHMCESDTAAQLCVCEHLIWEWSDFTGVYYFIWKREMDLHATVKHDVN